MESANEQPEHAEEDNPLEGVLAGVAQVALPLARMYLGPAARLIEHSERDPGAAERRVLLFALHKLVVEAGTLPAPGAAYEPHAGQFVVDEKGQAPALDLRHGLAALRALSAWAAAGPKPDTGLDPSLGSVARSQFAVAGASAVLEAQPARSEVPSTRSLRASARARSYGAVETPAMAHAAAGRVAAARAGGCGCRGGASAYAARAQVRSSAPSRSVANVASSYVSTRAPSLERTRKPSRCDCNGACGGRGCGCSGAESCLDCIPRGVPAADGGKCSCPSCTCAPESCLPWAPSCETRNRLRACLSDILCDLLRCIEEYLCGTALTSRDRRAALQRCLIDLLCKVLRCVREALCPPPLLPQSCPPPNDCLPCSYAVEESR